VSVLVFAAALAMAQLLRWNPLVVLAVSAVIGISARALGWTRRPAATACEVEAGRRLPEDPGAD
jgi:hypothetical protein